MVELEDWQQQETGQAATSLSPDIDRTHTGIFESLQLGGSYVGDLL